MPGNYWINLVRKERTDKFNEAVLRFVQNVLDNDATSGRADLWAILHAFLKTGFKGTFVATYGRLSGELALEILWRQDGEEDHYCTVLIYRSLMP
jgi:hypothetical protein